MAFRLLFPQLFEKRLESNVPNVTELVRQGITAVQAGRNEEARQALLRATELDERNEQAWLWLSGVVESFQDRRICLENVLAINPDNAHAQAGLRWLDQQAPVSPTAAAQELCPLCGSPLPEYGSTCPHCGQILVVACPDCGQFVQVEQPACPDCGQPLGDFREGARYHIGLARAYLEQHQGDLAQEAIVRAEATTRDDAQALKEVAALHEAIGHTDMAIAAYQLALEHAPRDAALYARLGAIYRRRAMPAQAREMYRLSRSKFS